MITSGGPRPGIAKYPSSPAAAALIVLDEAVRSAIAFLLEIEGIAVRLYEDISAFIADENVLHYCVVIDVEPSGLEPIVWLEELQRAGASEQIIVLASNPSRVTKSRITAAGAILVEKPLLSDILTLTIRRLSSGVG